jgi:hypothetical protein
MNQSKCIESILVYGVSGAGKTTQAQELAKYVYRTMGKKVRLASMSGGGWTSVQPAVDAGILVPTYLRGRKFPVETLNRVTLGWWPSDVDDPESPLLAPDKQPDYKDIGGIVFDGITEGADWLMSYIVGSEAAGKFKTSTQNLAASFKDGETAFGTPGLSHYGTVQQRIEDFVTNSKGLSGWYTMWTALELKATDDNSRLPLYGPDVCGKAKTAKAPAWFDNTLHLYLTGTGGLKKGTVVRRLYLTNHFEDDQIPYVAKNRGHYYAPLPEYLEGENCSVDKFLELLVDSHAKAKEKLLAELKPFSGHQK